MEVRAFTPADTEAVVTLWQRCELTVPWNNPYKDIERKLAKDPELFLVMVTPEDQVIGSLMGGYEGHRGWVNYLAVDPDFQRQGFAARLMAHFESILLELGCPKINLQVRTSNEGVIQMYQRLGYKIDDAVGLGKRLIPDRT